MNIQFRCLSILLFSLFILLHGCVKDKEQKKKPNVILILADDLGWTDPSFMGSKYYQTPNIDRLAESGLTFFNAYSSAANCSPSRATLLSGKYPTDHKIFTVGISERGNKKTRKLIPAKNDTIIKEHFFL